MTSGEPNSIEQEDHRIRRRQSCVQDMVLASLKEKKKKTQTQTEAKTRSEDRENGKGKTTQVRRYKMARQKHTSKT